VARRGKPSVESLLPLKPVVFHILLALAERDLHGYGVIQTVRRQSGGRINLETDDDPRRGVYYGLTPRGREVVAAEGRRLEGLVSLTAELGLLSGEGRS